MIPRVTLLLACLAAPLAAQSSALAKLDWLTGCWERRTPTAVVEEQWSSPRGGMLLGFSKVTVRDTIREFEFIRISTVADTLIYHALPSRQPPADFFAVGASDSLLTFSSPKHDFPQRIIYRRLGSDSLRARIEGMRNGQPRGIDYPYARVTCR